MELNLDRCDELIAGVVGCRGSVGNFVGYPNNNSNSNCNNNMAVARLFQQQQLLIKQLVITVVLQWL